MRLVPVCLRLIALLFTLTLAQASEPRTALVVGNADHSFGALENPINDAEALAKSLEEAGFAVTLETDADQAEQMSGENYLLPVSLSGLWDAGLGEETLTPEQ